VGGEFERIAEIRRRTARRSAFVALGVGDDAALLSPSEGFESAVSADLLVEGVHFRLDWTTPELLGHKALAVSLSDLAAMGAIPRAALFGVAVPAECESEFVLRLYDGILALADRFGVVVVGGDTSSSPGPVVIDSVVIGEVERGRAMRRSGARASDELWVSGTPGLSALGLSLLRSGTSHDASTGVEHDAIQAHLAPEPRIALGRALVELGLARAAIDVSDGLSSDVRHLCDESGVGVVIDAASLPSIRTPEDALHGGEAYELLFAAEPGAERALRALSDTLSVPLTRIGKFDGLPASVLLDSGSGRSTLPAKGWDHFG
jgi:thiamine-monophosphate kinase